MAEEAKKQEQNDNAKKMFWTVFKVVLGLVFLALGIYFGWRWWASLKELIKACIGPFLFLAGLITLAIAKE